MVVVEIRNPAGAKKQENKGRLSETAGFTLGFEEAEDVVFTDCSFQLY